MTKTDMVNYIGPIFEELKSDVRRLDGTVSGLKTDIGDLRARVGGLECNVIALRTDVCGLMAEVSELKTDVCELKSGFHELKMEVHHMGNTMKTNTLEILTAIKTLAAATAKETTVVAHERKLANLENEVYALKTLPEK